MIVIMNIKLKFNLIKLIKNSSFLTKFIGQNQQRKPNNLPCTLEIYFFRAPQCNFRIYFPSFFNKVFSGFAQIKPLLLGALYYTFRPFTF